MRASYLLGLKLQMLVSHLVGAGYGPQVFCKSRKCSLLPSRLSSPWGAHFVASPFSSVNSRHSSTSRVARPSPVYLQSIPVT